MAQRTQTKPGLASALDWTAFTPQLPEETQPSDFVLNIIETLHPAHWTEYSSITPLKCTTICILCLEHFHLYMYS